MLESRHSYPLDLSPETNKKNPESESNFLDDVSPALRCADPQVALQTRSYQLSVLNINN